MTNRGELTDQTVVLKGPGREFTVKVRNGVVILPKGVSSLPVQRAKNRSGFSTRTARVRLEGLKASPEYGPSAMTHRLVSALGSDTVAALLGVSKDRPGRWISGQDSPNEVNQLRLADLDALMGHLLTAFTSSQAQLWLEGHNAHLGAKPLDVYRLEGPAPVIDAIRAHEQGAYA